MDAAVGSDQDSIVVPGGDGVRFAPGGCADDIAEDGLCPLKGLPSELDSASNAARALLPSLDPRARSRRRATRMTYARARLWLGISGVGTFVLLALAGIALGWPKTVDGLGDAGALAVALLVYASISLPLDLLGGLVLPRRFGRRAPSLRRFAAGWLRGVTVQAGVMLGFGLLILAAGRAGGLGAATVAFGSSMFALVLIQLPLARWVGGLRRVADRDRVTVLASDDEGFTGGVVGPPGAARIIVPAHWNDQLGDRTTDLAIARRQTVLEGRARVRGLLLAFLFNLCGFLLAAGLVPGAGVSTASGLITLSLGTVLWSFLGLLLLPSLSRPAVHEVDLRTMRSTGLARSDFMSAIGSLDRLQDDEPERSRWVERVFHPLPSVRSREAMLEQRQPQTLAPISGWHAARNALFLSWACFGFLSRAVHCNAGRPALWVMLPCD